MKNYSTKQREILLDFFKNHLDETFSTKEIIESLKSTNISESAIYRNLASLEEEGRIKRVSKALDRKTYYQFIDMDECKDHIHMSCTKCGKTIHISKEISDSLSKSLKSEDGFMLDNQETVIYGTCSTCQKES